MPTPNRTAQSPLTRRRERVERAHKMSAIGWPVAAILPLDNIGAM